jgi:hypothetical protein
MPSHNERKKKRKASGEVDESLFGKTGLSWLAEFLSGLEAISVLKPVTFSFLVAQVNGEVGVKNSFTAGDLPGHKNFDKVEEVLDWIGEKQVNGGKVRGRSDKRKPQAADKRNKRDNSVNVNGKSASSGSEVSSDVGCQSPDSGAKDGDQTPSEAGSVDGGVTVLKRASSHGELRSEEGSKTEHFRKQSTLDSGGFF